MSENWGVGPLTSKICILSGEVPSVSAFLEKKPFAGWEAQLLNNALLQAGIHPDECRFELISYNKQPETGDEQACLDLLNSMPNLNMIVPMGNRALKFVTGKISIDKWHLSPLNTNPGFACLKCVPTFHPGRVAKEFKLHLMLKMALMRAVRNSSDNKPWVRKPKNFLLNPNFNKTIEILKFLKTCPVVANDIETGNGIINTVGFAWSESDAIAIQTLPDSMSADRFHTLWIHIADVLEDPAIKKIYQNNIYESMYYSRYGIRVQNTWHDTMWAQRLLYPEFDIGLDQVGRIYTNEPYWKDIGKDYKGEGDKRDWGNIKDWMKHFEYNCYDTTGTYEACFKQRKDLKDCGSIEFFDNYLMCLSDPIVEMCCRGLPINEQTRHKLEQETESRIKELTGQLSQEINPKSWMQKQKLLKDKGYKLPRSKSSSGETKESTNELALKKLRLKYPDDKDIQLLLEIAKLSKALGSYINIKYDSDGKMRFSIKGVGTETLRFSSSKDPWDRGLNAQTLPSQFKVMFDAPQGYRWIQVDLKQAESRFVAYDSMDTTLIEMLEDPTKDVHRFVASHIFEKPESDIVKSERQLGKKSGHGANYNMGVNTFMESCLKEMDLVLSRREATHVLETYHRLFPGIRRWHQSIKDKLYRDRRLDNPLGYFRYFYGRMDDNTFREAYAFKPQSTIPMITNYLMLHLLGQRTEGALQFDLHLQVHDSLVLLAKDSPSHYLPIIKACWDTGRWHPEIILPAGRLIIPTECETGLNLGKLTTIEEHHV